MNIKPNVGVTISKTLNQVVIHDYQNGNPSILLKGRDALNFRFNLDNAHKDKPIGQIIMSVAHPYISFWSM